MIQYDKQTSSLPPSAKSKHALKFISHTFHNISNKKNKSRVMSRRQYTWPYCIRAIARTEQTARKSTGGRAPREAPHTLIIENCCKERVPIWSILSKAVDANFPNIFHLWNKLTSVWKKLLCWIERIDFNWVRYGGSVIQYDKQTPNPPSAKSQHALKFVWHTFQNISNIFFM